MTRETMALKKSSPLLRLLAIFIFAGLTSVSQAAEKPSTAKDATEQSTDSAAANPQVQLVTNMGEIVIELFPGEAPDTVANFLQYVEEGYYSGSVFHRVIDGFMIQGGGFDAALKKKSTRAPVKNEANNGLKNDKFTIAMARTSDPHSASAQFFINVANNDFLNHTAESARGWGYAVFGEVVKGQDIVEKIAKVKTGGAGPFPKDVPTETVVIEQAAKVEG